MKIVNAISIFVLGLFFSLAYASPVKAAETNSGTVAEKEMESPLTEPELQNYDFDDIQGIIDNSKIGISFSELVSQLSEGNLSFIKEYFVQNTKAVFVGEIIHSKKNLAIIICISLFGAIFGRMALAFTKTGIADTGFYITYIALITVLISSFYEIGGIANNCVTIGTDFLKVMLPAFTMAIGMSGRIAAATGFSTLIIAEIAIIQLIYLNVLIPIINIYAVMTVVNSITKEEFMTKFLELIELIVNWILKFSVGAVVGINLVQTILTSGLDGLKSTVFGRAMAMIPGIGQGALSAAEMTISTGKIIKNSIGIAGMIIIISICAAPIIKLAVTYLMYQLTAALMQPVSDKRITECMSGIAVSIKMMLGVASRSILLEIISLTVVCYGTNG